MKIRPAASTPRDLYDRSPGTVKPLAFGLGEGTAKPEPASPRARPRLEVPKARNSLSHKQISTLIRHARAAYDIARDTGNTSLSFDDWRHIEVAAACGKPGLTAANNSDFRAILAHFLLLSGDSAGLPVSLNTGAAGGYAGESVEDREQAIFLILEACKKHDLSPAYAVAIAKRQFGVSTLKSLNAAQAMSILFTVNNRARGRKM